MNQVHALYRLQRIDLDLDTRRSRVREITARLEDDSALRQAQAELEQIRSQLRPQETRATNLNLELKSVAAQTTDLTARLYGGKVNNPKELQDIEHKIAELKRRQADLENDLLETMIAIEDLQAALAAATARLSEVEASLAAERETLTAEQHRLKREIKALKGERETAAALISEANQALYQTLRAIKQGHAVAVLKDDMCSYCRVGQTSNIVQQVRRGQDVVFCSSCGRILVVI